MNRRIIIGLTLGLILSTILTTTALAADSITINPWGDQKVVIDGDNSDWTPPPEITLYRKNGEIFQPGPPK